MKKIIMASIISLMPSILLSEVIVKDKINFINGKTYTFKKMKCDTLNVNGNVTITIENDSAEIESPKESLILIECDKINFAPESKITSISNLLVRAGHITGDVNILGGKVKTFTADLSGNRGKDGVNGLAGRNGSQGEEGDTFSNANRGENGGNGEHGAKGEDGAHGIDGENGIKNVDIQIHAFSFDKEAIVSMTSEGTNGAKGGNGGRGGNGGAGGAGGNGGMGGNIKASVFRSTGDGGNGGNGADGGDAGRGGNGGNGGNGGDGGGLAIIMAAITDDAGNPICDYDRFLINDPIYLNFGGKGALGGLPGNGGNGGAGGAAGLAGAPGERHGLWDSNGGYGSNGTPGKPGKNGEDGIIGKDGVDGQRGKQEYNLSGCKKLRPIQDFDEFMTTYDGFGDDKSSLDFVDFNLNDKLLSKQELNLIKKLR